MSLNLMVYWPFTHRKCRELNRKESDFCSFISVVVSEVQQCSRSPWRLQGDKEEQEERVQEEEELCP